MKAKSKTTIDPTGAEVEAAVLSGETFNFKGCKIAMRQYPTVGKRQIQAGYQVTVPAKITGANRQRKLFKSAKLAIQWIETFFKSRAESEATAAEAANFAYELPRLRRLGINVTDALNHYETTFIERETRKRLSEVQEHLIGEIELSAEEQGRDGAEAIALRPRSLESIKAHGRRVIADFRDCYADEVTHEQAMSWIKDARSASRELWSRKTRNHHWNHLNRLLNHAVGMGAITENPLKRITPERRKTFLKLTTARPEILTADEAEKLLTVAVSEEKKLIVPVALGLLAGLRTAEIIRLKWGAIDYGEDGDPVVVIDETIAKTRQERHVKITPALKAWLSLVPHGDPEQPIWPHTEKSYERAFRRLARKAGFKTWPHNAMRHSFASAVCALHGVDYARTQLGHSSGEQDTIFKHYRKIVRRAEAEQYFAIRPETKGNKVLKFAAAV